jgi:class 3 adenylate cyclase/DNA-binding beta-propeller fold protein YncE
LATTERPSGTVTFLFTDIEGSTALLKRLGRERYGELLGRHQVLLREAFAAHRGEEIDTQGDSFFVAFRSAADAVAAAVAIQRSLADHEWPEEAEPRVRIGIHSGEASTAGARYVGFSVHRAARIGSAAHGGQVLLSDATRVLVEDDLPPGVYLRDLGVYRLKDVDRPERITQVAAEGLPVEFPPLRGAAPVKSAPLRRRSALAAALVGVIAAAVAIPVFALSSGGSGGSQPLAANSVAVVDARRGSVVGDVPLTFTPTSVAAGGEQIWVLNAPGQAVSAIDPTTLHLVRTFGLAGSPSGQWSAGTADWVAMPGAVEMVDASSGNVSTISLARAPAGSPCVATVTGSGTRVWVAEARSLTELDSSGSVLRTLELPAVPGLGGLTCYGVRYTDGKLFAVRDPDESVGQLDPTTGTFTPIVSGFEGLSGTAQGLSWAGGFGSLWIPTQQQDARTLRSTGSLARIDLSSGQILSKTPVGGSVGGVAVDPVSGVWTVDVAGEQLVNVQPATAQVVRRVPLHHFACCSLATGHGRIWAVLQSP